jgi:putative RNA 2'-phosphotransferase
VARFFLARARDGLENPSVRTPLEELQSPKGAWKVEICQRDDGNFQVFLMRWIDEVAPDYGNVASFWSQVRTSVSITDSVEAARRIGRDLLRSHARDEYADEPETLTETSKFLSFVLRHAPASVGVVLDDNGWVEIDHLVEQCRAHGRAFSRDLVEAVVASSPKRRFAISEDGRRVRANQGHSIQVELGYEPAQPPEWLFHGTVASNLPPIRSGGLKNMGRHNVHLSPDAATARNVGMRRGKPILLRIAAARMHRDGHVFYLSANGVWLTEEVPPEYIEFPEP